jgi:triacylglycerol lipase
MIRFACALLAGLLAAMPAVAQPPPDIAAELQRMGRVIAPPPTAALYAPLHPATLPAGIRVLRDAPYGPDPRHRLDVFAPAEGGGPRPILVFVHGGGFVAGDKRMQGQPAFYDNIALWAVRNGFVAVNITYRLAPAHPFPAAQQDIAAALAWVATHAATIGGDPADVSLMGHSAGAIHAALYAADPALQARGVPPPRRYALVSGLFTFGDEEAPPNERAYFGEDRAQRAERSPAAALARLEVPVLLAHATLDPPRFVAQGEAMAAAMRAAGRSPTVVVLEGHSHISEILAVGTDDTSLTAPLLAFLRR